MAFRLQTAGVLVAALALAACAVGPDYQPPTLSIPPAWQGSGPAEAPAIVSSESLAQWWRQLGDRDLDRLIDQALSGNLDLKLSQVRLRQARARRSQAASDYFPTLSASTGITRSESAAAQGFGVRQTAATVYDAGFDATWEIDIFGGTRRAVEAADADLDAGRADVGSIRVTLVAEVAQNYVDLRSYQRRLAIARDNLTTQTETLQIIEWRRQAGLANTAEVEQARTTREQTRARIPDLEVARADAEHRLAVLLGANPGALRTQLSESRPLPDVPARVASGVPADVLRQRPDLIAAERRLAAETARVGEKLAQRFPGLSLNGSFGWQPYAIGAIEPASLISSIGGTLAATVFDGGRRRSAVEIQSAVQEQALLSYESSVLTALEDVENGLVAHAWARQRIDACRAAADAARTAAQLALRYYETGLADFQKVLDTERTQLTAEENLAVAEAAQLTSLIKIYKALGGGWESTVAAATSQEK